MANVTVKPITAIQAKTCFLSFEMMRSTVKITAATNRRDNCGNIARSISMVKVVDN